MLATADEALAGAVDAAVNVALDGIPGRQRRALGTTCWRLEQQRLSALLGEWLAVERLDGRDADIGYYRHWVDPTVPFAAAVAMPAQGVLVTSATLTDRIPIDLPRPRRLEQTETAVFQEKITAVRQAIRGD